MAIIRRSELQRHIAELEARFETLRKAVSGADPNENIYEQYANNPDDYRKEFVEVHLQDVTYALSDFRGVLKILESVNKLKADQLKKKK